MSLERGLELQRKLKEYDYHYYVLQENLISDTEYDRLFLEYVELEKKFSELKTIDSPTQRIGSEVVSGLNKITHKSPLLSINNKSQSTSDLLDWYNKLGGDGLEVLIQPKYDGLTINNYYNDNYLLYASTRGNGYIGEDISHLVKKVRSLPLSLNYKEELEVRGEGIIPFDIFKKEYMKSDKNLDGYSNPRNMASGQFRLLDNSEMKKTDIIYYDIGINKENFINDTEQLEFLKSLGFKVTPYIKVNNGKDLVKVCSSYMNGYIKEDTGFNVLQIDNFTQVVCDGLVIKVNNLKQREELGMTAKGPRWAFAYKFKSLRAETILTDVIWQVSKTGRINPVAKFKPFKLGGVTVEKATLNNMDFLRSIKEIPLEKYQIEIKNRNLFINNKQVVKLIKILKEYTRNSYDDLIQDTTEFGFEINFIDDTVEFCGYSEYLNDIFNNVNICFIKEEKILDEKDLNIKIGNTIVIERANDVIPNIVGYKFIKNQQDLKEITIPTHCPDCGEKIIDPDGGTWLYCTNINCPTVLKKKIEHFASRNAMNIESLGAKCIDLFVDKGYLTSISSIYELEKYSEELMQIKGYGKKKVDKLLKAIEKSKQIPFERVLYALSIDMVGLKTAENLAHYFNNIESIIKANFDDYVKVDGISDLTSNVLVGYFTEEQNLKLLKNLKELGLQFNIEEKELESSKFVGKTFVITGTFDKTRTDITNIIKANGGKCSSSVSKKTDYVLIGEDAGSKQEKAEKLVQEGNPIILVYGDSEINKLFN